MRSCCTWLITAPRPPLCSTYGHREPALGKTMPGRCCRARGAWGGMATEINWRTRGGGRSGFLRMLQALGKRQSCRRARAGPCEGSGSPGAGLGKVVGQELEGCGGSSRGRGALGGGTASEAPRRAQAVGEAVPKPLGGAGREGWLVGSSSVPAVHARRKRKQADGSEQAGLGRGGRVFPSSAGHGHIELLPGTGAAQRHCLFIKATHERSKEVTT